MRVSTLSFRVSYLFPASGLAMVTELARITDVVDRLAVMVECRPGWASLALRSTHFAGVSLESIAQLLFLLIKINQATRCFCPCPSLAGASRVCY